MCAFALFVLVIGNALHHFELVLPCEAWRRFYQDRLLGPAEYAIGLNLSLPSSTWSDGLAYLCDLMQQKSWQPGLQLGHAPD